MKRLLILLCSISCTLASVAENPLKQALNHSDDDVRRSGLSVSANLMPPVMQMFGKDYVNYEGMVTLNLKRRFFPQVAAGVGKCDETSDDGWRYQTKMFPYFKAGMVYNWNFAEEKYKNDFYGIFLRYGFSHSKADITGLHYTDGFWPEYTPSDILEQDFNCHWLELGAMIKVEIVRHVSLGWDLYFKPLVHKGDTRQATPYFIPGYGRSQAKIGFAFNLYYDI